MGLGRRPIDFSRDPTSNMAILIFHSAILVKYLVNQFNILGV
jgi:hypothetical protein